MEFALPALGALVLCLVAFCVLAFLRQGRRRKTGTKAQPRYAVVDGSNVMHWRENQPDLTPVRDVVALLRARGYKTGVIFDANAGWKLAGRYQDDAVLARDLGMRDEDVLVVPKSEQADPYLLTFAQNSNAILISADRFRDRIADYPALQEPGRLIRGGWRDDKVWLNLPAD